VDGTIEFVGRLDQQVKVRGYRIELGEIEQTLAGHPAVKAGVVIAREDRPGDKQLVAYVVSPAATTQELHSFLQERLPEYMVPAQLVLLDALPLTQNGKVDRKALPMPAEEDLAAERQLDAPRTPVETALSQMWCELLQIERIGINEDVFELGAHSLMAMRAVVRIRGEFAVDVPLRALFEDPTIAGLAQRVERAGSSGGEPPPVVRSGREEITL